MHFASGPCAFTPLTTEPLPEEFATNVQRLMAEPLPELLKSLIAPPLPDEFA